MKKIYQEFLIGQDKSVVKEINVAGAVIINTDLDGNDHVLLIKRSPTDHWPNVWEFPRGKCEKKDKNDLEKCLKREVKEETGLDIKIIKYIDKYEYIADGGKRKSTQYNYLCKYIGRSMIRLSKEHSDHKWVSSVGEVELLVPTEMKKTISKVLNKDEQIVIYPKTKEVIEETIKNWRLK